MQAQHVFGALSVMATAAMPMSCATHKSAVPPQELKSNRPKLPELSPNRTKPEPPRDRPVDDLPIEPLRTA
jgi:hypothetical protein